MRDLTFNMLLIRSFMICCLACVMLLIIAGTAASVVRLIDKSERPRLVGMGCAGTKGPIYADEEDIFPRCAAIEGN